MNPDRRNSGPQSTGGASRRLFVGTATTRHTQESGLADRPQLADELGRMASLFAELGYEIVPGFGTDLPAERWRRQLRAVLTDPSRTGTDTMVVYHTGHGIDDGDQLFLAMADTGGDITEAIWAEDLTRRLLHASPVRRLLILLDTCSAALGGAAAAQGAHAFLQRLRLDTSPSIAILVAARPLEEAEAGAFTRAFAAAVHAYATAGHQPPYLALEALTGVINATTPDHQHARLFMTTDGPADFLPNPRHQPTWANLDLWTQQRLTQRRQRAADYQIHVAPRARGLDTGDRDDLWLYTGRYQSLRDACIWLNDPSAAPTLIVTGDPGSGKSALLARLFVLASRDLQARLPRVDALPADTRPPLGAFTEFIYARGATPASLLAAIAHAADLDPGASTLTETIAALDHRHTPITLIIDAVDEADHDSDSAADTGFRVVDTVLAPLIRFAARRDKLRLLIGTRRHVIDRLGQPAQIIDLDDDVYADPESLRSYAAACLTRLVDASPYHAQTPEDVTAVADAVAAAAGRSFLVALIIARGLALSATPADPHDRVWRQSLPAVPADAMRADLNARLTPDDAAKARDLLLPLAYAQGDGLPWEDLWLTFATALSGRHYTNDDLDWLITNAGFYVVETAIGNESFGVRRSNYRLYHEAFAEHLRSERNVIADHSRIFDALLAYRTRHIEEVQHPNDWSRAHPYLLAHLATHAARSGRIDELALDPGFLLEARRSQLLVSLSTATTPAGLAAADAYRRADRRLRECDYEFRPAYLQLAARCGRAPQLADAIKTSQHPLTWTTEWAFWRLQTPHRIAEGHSQAVNAVALGRLNGRQILASGGDDCTVRLWDVLSCAPIGGPLTGHTRAVTSVVVAEYAPGRGIIASGSEDRTVRVWDATTRTAIGHAFIGHSDAITSVSVGLFKGKTIVASGSDDQTIRIWDIATGVAMGSPLLVHSDAVASVAIGELNGEVVVVSGSYDQTLRAWSLDTNSEILPPMEYEDAVLSVAIRRSGGRTIIAAGVDDGTVHWWNDQTRVDNWFVGHIDSVTSVAIGEFRGRPVVASGGADSKVRVWDPLANEAIGVPLAGHAQGIASVSIASMDDHAVVATASGDHTVRLWDIDGTRPVNDPFVGHTDAVTSIALGNVHGTPVVVTGSSDKTIRRWEVATGAAIGDACVGHAAPVNSVTVGLLESRVFIASASDDETIRLWDLVTGGPIGMPLVGHTDCVRSVVAGQMNGRAVLVSGSDDETVRLWDVATGQQQGPALFGHDDAVTSVAFGSVEGQTILASGSEDQTVRLWDAATGSQVGVTLVGHIGTVTAVTISNVDGRPVVASASQDGTVQLWDAQSGVRIAEPLTGHAGRVNAVSFGQIEGSAVVAAVGDDNTARMWDVTTGQRLAGHLYCHIRSVNAIALGKMDERTFMATAGEDATVRICDASAGLSRNSAFSGHASAVLSLATHSWAERSFVASASQDGTVRLWDENTGLMTGPVHRLGAAPSSIAIGDIGGRAVLATARNVIQLWDIATGDPLQERLVGHTARVNDIAFGRARGGIAIVSASDDGSVRLWDARTGSTVHAPLAGHEGPVLAVATFESEGRGFAVTAGEDAKIRIWAAETGNLHIAPMGGHTRPVRALAVGAMSGRRIIVSAGDDRSIRIWDAASGAAIGHPLHGHNARINAVAVHHFRGRAVIVSGGDDRCVRIWDAASGKALREVIRRDLSTNVPEVIDIESTVLAIAAGSDERIIVGAELGIACIRLTGAEC